MEGLNRIKTLSANITDKPLLKIIDYLLSRDDMNEKYLNEEKNLKQMVEFIRKNAEKSAKNGVAMIEDETVYSWAIHYFDESNETLNLKSNTNNSIEKNDDIMISTKVNTKLKKNKYKYSEEQLTLF